MIYSKHKSFELDNRKGNKMKKKLERKPYFRLKGYLAENDIKQREVAKLVGKSPAAFNQNINGTGADFSARDIRIICENYKLSADEYFFNQKVSN